MKLREVMTRGVEVVHPEATLREAARKMRQHDVGVLPVCDGDRIVGVVTDRDITVRATAEGRDPDRTKVGDTVTRRVDWLFEDEDVETAARLMRSRQIRRLLVLDRQKRLAGIVSLGDLATEGRDEDLAGDVLEGVSESRGDARDRGARGWGAASARGAGEFSQSNEGGIAMRDRFGRDVGYGRGEDDRDERQGPRMGFGDRDHDRSSGRMMGRDYDYNRDMGRDYGRDVGRDYSRDQGGYGRGEGRGMFGREDDRDYGRGTFGGQQGRGLYGRDMGQGGYDYNRGQYGREDDREYGRGSFGGQQGRGLYGRDMGQGAFGGDYPRGLYGREQDRDYNRGGSTGGEGRGVFGRDYDRGHDGSTIGTWTTRGPQGRDERSMGEVGRSAVGSIGEAIGDIGDRVRRAFGRGPKGYKRSDDRIREDICELLADRDDVDASEVTVRVQNGEVTLEGLVERRHDKRIIEMVSENVRGVDDVHNQIRVRRPGDMTTGATTGATGTTTGVTGTTGATTTPDGRGPQARGMANDGRRS